MKYQLFGHTGLRVSELCLGTMGFGTEWGWGADEEASKAVFDAYANAGGNFIDTANRYTEGTSERFIGDFIKADRDHFVLATKYTLKDKNGDPNFAGNHRKNMMRSVKESMDRLQTDYLDILWLHIWDFTTHPEEVLMGLNDLDHRLMHITDEDLFKRMVALNRNAELYRIKKLPIQFHAQVNDILIRMSELIIDLRTFNHEQHNADSFEKLLAYALLVDELKYMKEHLEKVV